MKPAIPDNNPLTRTVFVLSLACSLGGVLISAVSAQLSMPIVAWVAFYTGLAGFAVLALMLVIAACGALISGIRPRVLARKHAGFFDLGLSLALMAFFGMTAVTIENFPREMTEATASVDTATGAANQTVASVE